MNVGKIRSMLAAGATGIAVAGGAYGIWAIVNAILNASPMTQFLLAVSGLGAGSMVAYAATVGITKRE